LASSRASRSTPGPGAEAFSRYIAGHLAEVRGGKTYSKTSAAAREDGLDPKTAADLQAKADVLFKGEALRSTPLNAYGWWTVATLTGGPGVMPGPPPNNDLPLARPAPA